MNPTDHITRADRIQRIGELLAKGVALLLMREAQEDQPEASPLPGSAPDGLPNCSGTSDGAGCTTLQDDTDCSILDYIRRVRGPSPRDIQRFLDLSKATVFRRLNRLAEAGLVIRSGSTTAIRYRLAGPAPQLGPEAKTPVPSDRVAELTCP